MQEFGRVRRIDIGESVDDVFAHRRAGFGKRLSQDVQSRIACIVCKRDDGGDADSL